MSIWDGCGSRVVLILVMLSIGRQKAGQKKRDLGNKMGNIPLHKKEGLHKNKPFFMVVR